MDAYTDTIEAITSHEVYKQILKDSIGGVMYNVANKGKYDDIEIKALWHSLSNTQQSAQDGIMAGVFNFLDRE